MEAIGVVAAAHGQCQTILTTLNEIRHRVSVRVFRPLDPSFRTVQYWMKCFQDVQTFLYNSDLPQHERLVFIHSMEEINDGLKSLGNRIDEIIYSRGLSARSSGWFVHLANAMMNIIRQIEGPFMLIQSFLMTANNLRPSRQPSLQTTSDLQASHQRAITETLAEPQPPILAPTATTQPQVVVTELQDEIYIDEVEEQAFRFPDQLVFESGENFVLTLKETTPKPDITGANELFQQEDGHEGLQRWLRGLGGAQGATKEANIVVCGQPSIQGAVTLKDEAVLLDVLKTLKVPLTSVYRMLDEGIPMLIEHKASPPSTGTCFTFRLPLSQNEDWTLGIYWDPSLQAINASIHGMQNVERLAFSHKLVTALADIQHPMLLPVILCELLTAGDIASVRGTANQLQEVESRTRWSGVFDDAMDAQQANEGARVSFSQMTQRLNVAISRLPTREARTKANILLVERILECIYAIANEHCPQEEGENTRKNEALWKSTNRLKARLQVLQATQNALLLEIAREYQIASSQLQIVYNLVAQRDNKNNYEMAKISLEIARTTKDDSFAMFTLAVMSILFLPGVFIATLFSMDLFDWSAEDGERVINSRFWTYWAIALPLTLIVLIGWLSWLKMHQKNEDRKQKIVPMAASQQTHLSCPNPRHSDVSQCRNETAAHATTSAIEDADVGSGRQSWKVYSRRKASRASSLSPGIVPDVEMNDKDDEPSRAAVEPAVLVTTEVPSARSLKQGSMEEAMKRSYTFAAQGLRRD